MANQQRITNPSRLLLQKRNRLFEHIKRAEEKGEIRTEIERQHLLYQAARLLLEHLDKPIMQKRYAKGTPVSMDYNTTMKEVGDDLAILFAEAENLAKALQEAFEQAELERQKMLWSLGNLQDDMKDIALRVKQETNEVVFRDSFLDSRFFDTERAEQSPATIHLGEGVLTLTKIDGETLREGLTVRIVEGNGHPGNTHQVRVVNGQIRFYGEDSLHLDLGSMLDGNADTWFEYEAFYVTPETKERMAGYGFAYKEGIPWVLENPEPLRLFLEISLPYPQALNWISLSPFLPSDKGVAPAVVKSLVLHDGKGGQLEVSSGNDVLNEEKVFVFPRQKCKTLTLKLEQTVSYETQVGHFFYKELENQASFLAQGKEQIGRRIDGPMPSIEWLGYRYDPSTKTLIQPESTRSIQEEQAKEKLFRPQAPNERTQAGVEVIPARRYVIGIRDLSLSSYRFSDVAEYVSIPFESPDEIREVRLEASTFVPSLFGEGDWIEYWITVDDGKTWHPIEPVGSTKPHAKTAYVLNGNVPMEGRWEHIGYIDTGKPVKAIRLKIILRRPQDVPDSDYYTPVVYEYKLRCRTVKGEQA